MRWMMGPLMGAWLGWLSGLCPTVAFADEPGQSGQGTKLHGTSVFDDEHVSLWLDSVTMPARCTGINLSEGGLRGSKLPIGSGDCEPEDFAGLEFAAVNDPTLRFQILSVQRHESIYKTCQDGSRKASGIPELMTWEYEVTFTRAEDPPKALCENHNVALAIPLQWTNTSMPRLTPSTSAFVFACVPKRVEGCDFEEGGVIAKCVDWGYPPWRTGARALTGNIATGATTGGGELEGSLEEAQSFHQTCLRMATADYCGTGQPNTLDGTPIAFFDTRWVPLDPNSPHSASVLPRLGGANDDLYLEAAWVDCSTRRSDAPPVGACLPQGRRVPPRFGAVCLSKLRWSTLPVAGTCFDPEGYTKHPPALADAKFCEEYSERELEELGARFFTYSRFLDKGLYRFSTPGTPDWSATTTAYVVEPNPNAYPNVVTLDTARLDLDDSVTYPTAQFEGALLSNRLPEFVRHHQALNPVYRCVRTDSVSARKYFLTNTTPTSDPKDACPLALGWSLDMKGTHLPELAFEGYVARDSEGFMDTPLYLWTDGLNHFLTSVSDPGSPWQQVAGGPLGYIPGNP